MVYVPIYRCAMTSVVIVFVGCQRCRPSFCQGAISDVHIVSFPSSMTGISNFLSFSLSFSHSLFHLVFVNSENYSLHTIKRKCIYKRNEHSPYRRIDIIVCCTRPPRRNRKSSCSPCWWSRPMDWRQRMQTVSAFISFS